MFKFKECREKAGLTQKAAALSLKVSVQSISNWETGIRSPGLEQLVRIAELYGVTTDYLLGRTPMEVEVVEDAPPALLDDHYKITIKPDEKTLSADELERRIVDIMDRELKKRGL